MEPDLCWNGGMAIARERALAELQARETARLEAWKRPSRSTRGTSRFAGPLEAAAEAAEAAKASESRMQASFAETRADLAEAERTLTTEARDVQVQDSGWSWKLLSLVCSRSSTRLH